MALFVFTVSTRANPPLKAEVMHRWTSPGESAALEQFAEAFNQAGGEWVDVAVVGGNNAIPAELSRVTGGNPPTILKH
jgi:glucose/mannose transport system substrate-binding protein